MNKLLFQPGLRQRTAVAVITAYADGDKMRRDDIIRHVAKWGESHQNSWRSKGGRETTQNKQNKCVTNTSIGSAH
jgi:hypothetical protein